jgi:hypothetical protein
MEQVEAAFGGRVVGIDNAVADRWGRRNAVIDDPLAATAAFNDLTLVTRNDREIASLGAAVSPMRRTAIFCVSSTTRPIPVERAIARAEPE